MPPKPNSKPTAITRPLHLSENEIWRECLNPANCHAVGASEGTKTLVELAKSGGGTYSTGFMLREVNQPLKGVFWTVSAEDEQNGRMRAYSAKTGARLTGNELKKWKNKVFADRYPKPQDVLDAIA